MRRFQKKIHKSKKDKKQKIVRGTVVANKHGTRAHIFDNAIYRSSEEKYYDELQRSKRLLKTCNMLMTKLDEVTPDGSWVGRQEPQKLFRIVSAGRDPLDTKITFGGGGRLNIGMAQTTHNFKSLKATGGIYASCDFETAKAEYESTGIPLQPCDEVFELIPPQKELLFLDYDIVIQFLDLFFDEIKISKEVASSPTEGCWQYEKFPHVSQIIANWLQTALIFDAFIFTSTKHPIGRNVHLVKTEGWIAKRIIEPF